MSGKNRTRTGWQPETGPDGASGTAAAHAEIAEQVARQDARLLAGNGARAPHACTFGIRHRLRDRNWRCCVFGFWKQASRSRIVRPASGSGWDQLTGIPTAPSSTQRRTRPCQPYAAYLATEAPYDSGDFLIKPVDPARPRFVPELLEMGRSACGARPRPARAIQRTVWAAAQRTVLPYERYIERQHRPDTADLDFCRQHGFFGCRSRANLAAKANRRLTTIWSPRTRNRLADVAVSLTIQANTSIGTTPILLARDKDLPTASKDLAAFMADEMLQRQMQDALDRAVARLSSAGTERHGANYRAAA